MLFGGGEIIVPGAIIGAGGAACITGGAANGIAGTIESFTLAGGCCFCVRKAALRLFSINSGMYSSNNSCSFLVVLRDGSA